MTEFSHPAIGAALTTAATLLGMEAVFIGAVTDETFTFIRTQGRWRGVNQGDAFARSDSMCARMLDGAPAATADAANDPHYSSAALRQQLGITSYVGVPVRNDAGRLLGTLCGVDHRSVSVDGGALTTLRHLATTVACIEAGPGTPTAPTAPTAPTSPSVAPVVRSAALATGPVTITRTAAGWRVGDTQADDLADDLTMAMALGDLLAGSGGAPGQARPLKADESATEVERLRVAVTQLDHALTARIVIEQAIGVVAERFGLRTRDAFELLRAASRSTGRRVYDMARDLTSSAVDDVAGLPPSLRRR